ncbi:TMAO reductase system periplasmic protein TorT [Vibrio europaeus]|uniref:TMAO reductase system periplasmic protein TorT n=1 Tax=Vibrio europaeus TaxID=300876 RepID=A0AAE7DZE0_9VIBR|nr:TMAO reductase system periplasmic protein TorT [Vibrio europaeus]MDC5852175.1 TMAO reductase system periplasmic protein TorT [Vibrio europaeus]MDC5855685.1 TMAO reductase system periplasmic protein TorT [Vibrio europaeus]QJY39143.1 TMAO reductase system periplasmic protein TorT [Vibrio europaeus]
MSLISAIKTPKTLTTSILLTLFLFSASTFAAQTPRICAIYPHLKDSYWLSVNYGMVDEADKQDVDLRVLEAGGYLNLEKQREHMALCVKWGADAIILGTVAPDLFYSSLSSVSSSVPVFATVNKLVVDPQNQTALKGEVGVDWYWMGYYVGDYLKSKHPAGSGQTNIALLPGPQSSGGTKPVIQGFYSAIKGSDINVVETYWADNDKELQRNLVQKAIDNKNINYIVGSAVAIEAAISELRSANRANDIGLVSTYLSHGVYRGLLRSRVEFAPTDKMVLQGRLSIQQAVHYLRGENYNKIEAPIIEPLTPNNLNPEVIAQSLSPSEYRPTFYVYNENN